MVACGARVRISVAQYGWLSAGDPDPAGKRLEVVRAALKANPHIEGFFWDYASLYQAPSLLSLPPLHIPSYPLLMHLLSPDARNHPAGSEWPTSRRHSIAR